MTDRDVCLMVPPACETCRWWEKRYPTAPHLGVCTKMVTLLWTEDTGREFSVTVHTDDRPCPSEPTRTKNTFGCRGHSDFLMMRYQEL